jgi:uncharacterized membrane protein
MMTGVCAACGAPTEDGQAPCPSCGEQGSNRDYPPAEVREQGRVPENLAAVLAYITVVPAIILLFTKPYSKNEFVRFHAFQCIGLAAASFGLTLLFLLLANLPAINLLLIPVSLIVGIGIALVVLVCMIKAYQHETFPLPVLGDWARKQSQPF